MDSMSVGRSCFASTRARRDAMLKWSEPQKRMRSGSTAIEAGAEL